ncbi:MAG: hypothetical protein A3B79_03365 [Deltaproteobacteria bacterium RIFCSPHIGHO2_02_FULL_50_15]|nr:MAG: hypothetical protein A3B79_03365 [Deltaproteobacteria bacterium RIFCSPHIGHO2_02_FULL_50_15]
MPYFSYRAGKLFLWGTLLVLLFTSSACFQSKPTNEDSQEGSASLSPDETGLPQAIFPHPAEWQQPTSHGSYAVQFGAGACLKCHDAKTPSKGSPACLSCHPLYPHPEDWIETHRPYVREKGKISCTTACHGEDLKGGGSFVSCNRCHTLYPHGPDWKEVHGTIAQGTDKILCRSCHGEDYKGGASKVSCYQCHDYPHPDAATWIPFSGGHGEKVKMTYGGDTEKCQKCHGEDLQKILNKKNCLTCHPALFKHEPLDPWKTYDEGHGKMLLASPYNKDLSECQLCHGEDYQGGSRGLSSCYECHVSFPHLASWGPPTSQHGPYVSENSSSSCATEHCHGTDLTNPTPGMAQGLSCLTAGCHSEIYPHIAEWTNPANHGPSAEADLNQCQTCHGADLTIFPPGHQKCLECHPGFPHEVVPNWETTGHGLLAVNLANRDKCKDCHGSDLLGGTSGQSCKECHNNFPHPPDPEGALSCPIVGGQPQCWTLPWTIMEEFCDDWEEDCWTEITHYVSPHAKQFLTQKAAGFPNPQDHAEYCLRCHGDNYAGGNANKPCAECHENYPHHVVADWKTAAAGGLHVQTFLAELQGGVNQSNTSCTLCHTGLAGGPEGYTPSCLSCHEGLYPHLRINVPASPGVDSWIYPIAPGWNNHHGLNFLLRSYDESHPGVADNDCKDCHGMNLEGEGVPAKNCKQCHTYGAVSHSYPEWRGNAGTGAGQIQASEHGKNYIKARLAGFPAGTPEHCETCHDITSRRPPNNVCNPYKPQFPGSALNWCVHCHDMPAGGCPANGCPPNGVCP